MASKELIELTEKEIGKLSQDQIRRIFRYARIMLNIFKLSPNAYSAMKDLERELEDTNLDFDKEGFMTMAVALCLLSRSPKNGSQFYLTEDYDLTPSHEQGFKSIIDGHAALGKKTEYISGLAIDVYFLG